MNELVFKGDNTQILTYAFFYSEIKNEVRVFRYHKHRIVAVEYEDFLPTEEVEQSVRTITGDEYLVTVKRECSDRMELAIVLQMLRQVNEEFHSDMMESEFPSFQERMDKFRFATA